MDWQKIIFLIIGAGFIWLIYRSIKGNKAAFSKENLSKGFGTLGFLALFLIGIVALAVLMTR